MDRLYLSKITDINYAIEHFVKVCEMNEWTDIKKAAVKESLDKSISEIELLCPPGAKELFTRTSSQIDSMNGWQAANVARELRNRFNDDTKAISFFVIPSSKIGIYDKKHLFGDEVFSKFPSVNADISEAGKCLALDRGTACVFHLMRVVEVGLDALAKRLRIPPQNNWGQYLRRIAESLDAKKKPLPKWVKRNESFFRDSAMIIAGIKDKWRNPCVHRINEHYTPNQAEDVFDEIKKLMVHLSTKLKERRQKAAHS